MSDTRDSAVLTVAQLAELLASAVPPVLLDVRWVVGSPALREDYLAAHIPGALFVDLDADFADPPSARGRHPLPDPERLQRRLADWGVHPDSTVVLYDGATSLAAARGWWVLRWAGLTDVRVLNGGFAAWSAADGPIESGAHADPGGGDAVVTPGSIPSADADAAAAAAAAGFLVDVRVPERFRGEVEPIDPVAGHIPGALNLPVGDLLTASGQLAHPRVVQRRLEEAGAADEAEPLVVYCGSGVTAAQAILALHEAGRAAVLYPGSWSEWITDPARPISPGPRPN